MTFETHPPGMESDDSSETESEGTEIVDRFAPEEVFVEVGNRNRLRILKELAMADRPLSFSDLYKRTDIADSGQFNYHLEKLLGSLVEERDAGYENTVTASHIVGQIFAGQYTKAFSSVDVPLDSHCPDCDNRLNGRFEKDLARVRCPACDRDFIRSPVPAGALENRPREEWPEVVDRWTRIRLRTVEDGFCPICYGQVATRLKREAHGDDAPPIPAEFAAVVVYSCQRCENEVRANVEASLVTHPAVIAFHDAHGVDLRETPIWEHEWAITPLAEVVDTDPLEVTVEITLGDEGLTAWLRDGEGSVDVDVVR